MITANELNCLLDSRTIIQISRLKKLQDINSDSELIKQSIAFYLTHIEALKSGFTFKIYDENGKLEDVLPARTQCRLPLQKYLRDTNEPI